jgi:hypothetical protein
MPKTKRSNQLTRKDKKRMEEKNNQCTMKKPSNDRLPQPDGIRCICKIKTEYGGKRFGCEILKVEGLDLNILKKTWDMNVLNDDTELKAKLKGSFRNNTKSKVFPGNIVCVSYGDTIDFKYTNEESSYILSNMMTISEIDKDEVTFADSIEEEEKTIESENLNEDNINLDNINLDDI